MNRTHAMLGLSIYPVAFPQNTEAVSKALETIKSFGLACGPDTRLGIETQLNRDHAGIRAVLDGLSWPGPVYLWDAFCTGEVKDGWPIGLPFPFDPSYGGITNILLVLAALAGCDLVRVDPGTSADENFEDLQQRHLEAMRSGTYDVVSGQYAGDERKKARLALRCDFVSPASIEAYLDLIKQSTGIDPRRQSTSGAGLVTKVPAITFRDLYPWASDDGFFQLWDPTRVGVLPTTVRRTEAGLDLGTGLGRYPERLALMVALAVIHGGVDDKERIMMAVRGFLTMLHLMVKPERRDQLQTDEILGKVANGIETLRAGLERYPRLREQWMDVVVEACRRAQSVLRVR